MKKILFPLLALMMLTFASCSDDDDDVIKLPEGNLVTNPESNLKTKGFYILNEGAQGSNQATIDYFDYTTGKYEKNLYAKMNPSQVKELGDAGNDLQVYDNKLFAVINGSDLVDVMHASSLVSIKQFNITSPRSVAFNGDKAYVCSAHNPIKGESQAKLDSIYEIDLTSMKITRAIAPEGRSPESMVVVNNKLFVSCNGGIDDFTKLDNKVNVIDLKTFKFERPVLVGANPTKMQLHDGKIYVNIAGNYDDVPAQINVIDPTSYTVAKIDIEASKIAFWKDQIYFYNIKYGIKNTVTYGIYDLKLEKVLDKSFLPAASMALIQTPYGLDVNPENGDIIITDALTYSIDGLIYYFDKDGKTKWITTTGQIPGHLAFLYK